MTKDGSLAGPRVLEHLVDCVLQFEGDRYLAHRVLRATKNRFGSTNELAVFEMTATGLVGVPDPSAVFGRERAGRDRRRRHLRAPGHAAAPARDPVARRARPTSRCRAGSPPGVDQRRLAMIVAVLARHGGLPLGAADVFVNVAGGVRIDEPGADLGIALAIASAARGAARARTARRVRRARPDRAAARGDARPRGGSRSAASSASTTVLAPAGTGRPEPRGRHAPHGARRARSAEKSA